MPEPQAALRRRQHSTPGRLRQPSASPDPPSNDACRHPADTTHLEPAACASAAPQHPTPVRRQNRHHVVADSSRREVNHGWPQDHHRALFRTRSARRHACAIAFGLPLTPHCRITGPGHRLPPRHPLVCAMAQLLPAACRRDIRYSAAAELDLWQSSQSR